MEDARKALSHDTWLGRLSARLFRDQDATARRHGWHIKAGRGGLSRTYRDPRFDRLARCPMCRGSGTDASQEACDGCAATGRVTLARPAGLAAGRWH
jgi:hypothetical protein